MAKNRNLRQKITSTTHIDALNDRIGLNKSREQHGIVIKDNEEEKTNKCLNISKAYYNIFSNFCMPSDDALRSITSDNENGSFLSSSTLSWEDDYEYKYTEKVANEMRLMERVLQGKESIPSNYDEDEYRQWMNKFPSESFSFTNMRRDTSKSNSRRKKSTNVKDIPKEKKVQERNEGPDDLLQYFDNILRISPISISQTNTLKRKGKMNKSSSKGKQCVSSRNITPDYSSLPEITIDNYITNSYQHHNNNNNNISSAKTSMSIKGRHIRSVKNENGKRTYNQAGFLPPLKNNNNHTQICTSSREMRSISITPRQIRNGMSAISDILTTRKIIKDANNCEKYNRSTSLQIDHLNNQFF